MCLVLSLHVTNQIVDRRSISWLRQPHGSCRSCWTFKQRTGRKKRFVNKQLLTWLLIPCLTSEIKAVCAIFESSWDGWKVVLDSIRYLTVLNTARSVIARPLKSWTAGIIESRSRYERDFYLKVSMKVLGHNWKNMNKKNIKESECRRPAPILFKRRVGEKAAWQSIDINWILLSDFWWQMMWRTAGKPASLKIVLLSNSRSHDNGDYIRCHGSTCDEGDTPSSWLNSFHLTTLQGHSENLYGKLASVYDYHDDSSCLLMEQGHYSAFSGTGFRYSFTRRAGCVTTVVFDGSLIDICVLHTAIDACNLGWWYRGGRECNSPPEYLKLMTYRHFKMCLELVTNCGEELSSTFFYHCHNGEDWEWESVLNSQFLSKIIG